MAFVVVGFHLLTQEWAVLLEYWEPIQIASLIVVVLSSITLSVQRSFLMLMKHLAVSSRNASSSNLSLKIGALFRAWLALGRPSALPWAQPIALRDAWLALGRSSALPWA